MRRVVLALLTLGLAAGVAAPAWAEHNPHVVVTGHGIVAGGARVVVAAYDHTGNVGGVLRVDSAPGFLFVSRVTCVRRVAFGVLVGGVIVRSPSEATLGNTSLVAIADGGPDGPDLLGIAFSRTGLDSCPIFPIPLHPVESGKFTIVSRSG